MRLKKNTYIWAAASLVCMVVIFMFSSFPAEQSSGMSSPLVDWPLSLIENLFGVAISFEVRDFFHSLVRKAAHLLIYLALGVTTANTVRHITSNRKRVFLISLCWSSFYALTDEIHQYFVPGRSCMWQDWVLDTVGVLIGIGLVFLYMRRREKASIKVNSIKGSTH